MRARSIVVLLLQAAALVHGIVPTVRLRNQVEVPLISAGVYQYNETQAYESIAAALRVGFTAIDTALDCANAPRILPRPTIGCCLLLSLYHRLACAAPRAAVRRLEPGRRWPCVGRI